MRRHLYNVQKLYVPLKKGRKKKLVLFQTFSLTFPHKRAGECFLFVWCVSYLDAECDVHLNLSFDKGGKGVLTLGTGLGLFGCK